MHDDRDEPTGTAQLEVQAQALASAPYGAFICARNGTFLHVNAAFLQLTAYRADELIGQRTFHSLLDPAELARRGAELPGVFSAAGASAGGDPVSANAGPASANGGPTTAAIRTLTPRYESEWTCVRRNNTRVPVMLALAPLNGAAAAMDGRIASHEGVILRDDGQSFASAAHHGAYVGMVVEVSHRADADARLWFAENHDGVTRLPNQTLFAERLDLTIARCRRNQTGFTVLLAELNSLRKLRDALGSHAAELVLQIIGQRLRGLIGYEGTIASVSGTQFALLVNETGTAADALAAAALSRIAAPIDCAGTTLNLTASLGSAAYPEDGDDSPSLLRRANVALSAATAAGGNLVRRFSAALDGQAARRFELETMLREALERQQLHLVYQPQITLATGQLVQVETLLRWTHPKRGAISPAEFVPVAEETGLIDQIGEWVIRTACRDAGRLLRLTGNLPRVAINVSPQQFRRRNLLAIIESALHDAALDPSYIEVEITEGVLLGDTEDALHTLHALRKLGVEVAVDDFGTGYSSLAYLTRFPLNRLKIDRSFVVRMTTDAQSAALVGAIIAMAHALKLRVTAEGVETEEQAARLAELGCDEVQGFWFARPLSLSALRNLLEPLGQRQSEMAPTKRAES